jgi:hypothetical protein
MENMRGIFEARTCTHCKIIKPITEFYKCPDRTSRKSKCKKCLRFLRMERYYAHKLKKQSISSDDLDRPTKGSSEHVGSTPISSC